MFFGLRPYQLQGADFILQHPKCGVFFDCGLGKTLVTLSAIHHDQPSFLPALVIAPLRVAKFVWPAEITKWGFDFSHKVIHGRDKKGQLAKEVDLTIVNPEGLKSIVEFGRRFRTVVVDESTYFKNKDSKRWNYAKRLTDRADRVILQTGTPIAGRGHLDLWAQFALLGNANPLGSWWQFTQRHFTFDIFNRPNIRRGHANVLNQLVAPLVIRKSVDELQLPGLLEIDDRVSMNPEARRRYKDASLEENSYAPYRTIASGFAYEMHWSGERNTTWFNDAKITALEEIKESSGENLLVFANFTAEVDRIRDHFGAGVIDGRTGNTEAATLIEAWNQGILPMLVMHPRSGGHGLNLQEGGHRVVWFSLPDSGELYQQANARLYRSGQQQTVFVHKLICEDTIDLVIDGLLKKKCLNEKNLLQAVR